MESVREFFSTQLCTQGQLAEFTLTTVGILTLVVGLLVMPAFELTEAGFYIGLLALVAFMVLSFCAGQLVVIRDRISRRDNS